MHPEYNRLNIHSSESGRSHENPYIDYDDAIHANVHCIDKKDIKMIFKYPVVLSTA